MSGVQYIDDMNHALKSRIVFLTNGVGEETGYGEIPKNVWDWYDNLSSNSYALLYLAMLDGQIGIFAIYEYDDWRRNNAGLSEERFWITVQSTAEKMAAAYELQGNKIFLGKNSGFSECHEIAFWFPYPLGRNRINELLSFSDGVAYSDFEAKSTVKDDESPQIKQEEQK